MIIFKLARRIIIRVPLTQKRAPHTIQPGQLASAIPCVVRLIHILRCQTCISANDILCMGILFTPQSRMRVMRNATAPRPLPHSSPVPGLHRNSTGSEEPAPRKMPGYTNSRLQIYRGDALQAPVRLRSRVINMAQLLQNMAVPPPGISLPGVAY